MQLYVRGRKVYLRVQSKLRLSIEGARVAGRGARRTVAEHSLATRIQRPTVADRIVRVELRRRLQKCPDFDGAMLLCLSMSNQVETTMELDQKTEKNAFLLTAL
jgi:hypothetical protein